MTKWSNCEKEKFLKEGAIFGDSQRLFLLWGEPHFSNQTPQSPAVTMWNFFENKPQWVEYSHCLELSYEEAQSYFEKSKRNWNWEPIKMDSFVEQFQKVKNWIEDKKITKAVPYCFETSFCEVKEEQKESFIHHALENKKGFIYGQWNNETGVIGLTPEILLDMEERKKMTTMALAGTLSLEKFDSNPELLLGNEKEIFEHEEVVSSIEEKLQSYGELKKSKREVLKTPSLAHLFTRIELQLAEPVDPVEMAMGLHPTPALGCRPSALWKEVMGELDNIDQRGSFGAPFGFVDSNNRAKFVVAIRNISWTKKEAQIGAGCGVVEASELYSEWDELEKKRNSVKQIFGVL